jgi:hypothetical protein
MSTRALTIGARHPVVQCAEAGGYLRGTKTWPLTPKPPSAVSKI